MVHLHVHDKSAPLEVDFTRLHFENSNEENHELVKQRNPTVVPPFQNFFTCPERGSKLEVEMAASFTFGGRNEKNELLNFFLPFSSAKRP